MESNTAVNEAVSAIVTGTSIPTVTKENQEQFRSQQPVTVLTFTAPWPNTEHMSPPQPPQLYVQCGYIFIFCTHLQARVKGQYGFRSPISCVFKFLQGLRVQLQLCLIKCQAMKTRGNGGKLLPSNIPNSTF